jgi:hypothetical protein
MGYLKPGLPYCAALPTQVNTSTHLAAMRAVMITAVFLLGLTSQVVAAEEATPSLGVAKTAAAPSE